MRWSVFDVVAGTASLVLLISVFLSWFAVNISLFNLGAVRSASSSGTSIHPYLWVAFACCVVVLLYLVARAVWSELPSTLAGIHELVLVGLTGVSFVVTLVAFVIKPSADAFGDVGVAAGILGQLARGNLQVSVTREYGAYVALAVAVLALAAGLGGLIKKQVSAGSG